MFNRVYFLNAQILIISLELGQGRICPSRKKLINNGQKLNYQHDIQRHSLMMSYVLASGYCYCLILYILLFLFHPSYVLMFLCLVAVCQL